MYKILILLFLIIFIGCGQVYEKYKRTSDISVAPQVGDDVGDNEIGKPKCGEGGQSPADDQFTDQDGDDGNNDTNDDSDQENENDHSSGGDEEDSGDGLIPSGCLVQNKIYLNTFLEIPSYSIKFNSKLCICHDNQLINISLQGLIGHGHHKSDYFGICMN